MKAFAEVLRDAFTDEHGYWSLRDGEYELCVEPLLFDGQWYVALYRNGGLVGEKLPVKAGK